MLAKPKSSTLPKPKSSTVAEAGSRGRSCEAEVEHRAEALVERRAIAGHAHQRLNGQVGDRQQRVQARPTHLRIVELGTVAVLHEVRSVEPRQPVEPVVVVVEDSVAVVVEAVSVLQRQA